MKKTLICLSLLSLASLTWIAPSFAGLGDLPEDLTQEIFSHLSSEDLKAVASVKKGFFSVAQQVNSTRWKAKAKKVGEIMGKFGPFITLSNGDGICPVAPTQELWVKVMENSPSVYKEEKYCPDTYKTVVFR